MQNIHRIFEKQKENRWHISQTTANQRIEKLEKLYTAIWDNRERIQQSVYDDFRKNFGETDLTEIHTTLAEIRHTITHLKKWMKPRRVTTPMLLFGTRSEVRYEARGQVLILSPWNYPFNLAMIPLITAMAAGNCVMLKPSSKVPHTSKLIYDLIAGLFDENEVAVIIGDRHIADTILTLPFDFIFFTGSPAVGKKVMGHAAHHLAPVLLELGGKSPVIVDKSANITQAAERIMWAKFVNAGQTCVAPDYLLIHESQLETFIAASKRILAQRFGKTAEEQQNSPDFCRMVTQSSCEHLNHLLDTSVQQGAVIETGGTIDVESRYIAPTLLTNIIKDSPIMKEEIFGPILPIIPFHSTDDALQLIRSYESPLALYIFSQDETAIEKILSQTTAGGTCVNSLMLHLANPNLPFGGVGNSGMGSYHGFYGFRSLSHERAVLRQKQADFVRFFYPPYTRAVKRMIELSSILFTHTTGALSQSLQSFFKRNVNGQCTFLPAKGTDHSIENRRGEQ